MNRFAGRAVNPVPRGFLWYGVKCLGLASAAVVFCLADAQPGSESSRPFAVRTPDLVLRVSEAALQRFAQAAQPFTLQGRESVKVSAPVIGTVSMEVPWTGVVTNPRITVRANQQLFASDVTVKAGPLQYHDTITGRLEASWDDRARAIVVRVKEAKLNVRLGQGAPTAAVDVSDRVPAFVLPVQFADPSVEVEQKSIRVRTQPKMSFEDGALVVTSDLLFEPEGR